MRLYHVLYCCFAAEGSDVMLESQDSIVIYISNHMLTSGHVQNGACLA